MRLQSIQEFINESDTNAIKQKRLELSKHSNNLRVKRSKLKKGTPQYDKLNTEIEKIDIQRDELAKKMGDDTRISKKYSNVTEQKEGTYEVQYWVYRNDDFDNDEVKVHATSDADAIEKAKQKAPNRAKKFKVIDRPK